MEIVSDTTVYDFEFNISALVKIKAEVAKYLESKGY